MEGQAAAAAFVAESFPEAFLAVLAGSASSGTLTATSDLDIVVVLDGSPAPYRETLRYDGWLVELFAHTPASLDQFYTSERTAGRCTLAHMITNGIVLTDKSDGALRRAAQRVIDDGPEPLPDPELARRRYMLSADLDDLADTTDAGERATIAAHIVGQVTDLYLRSHGLWSGYGKWAHRNLAAANETLANRLTDGLTAALGGDPVALTAAVDEVLAGLGGRLADGYHVGTTRDSNDSVVDSGITVAPAHSGDIDAIAALAALRRAGYEVAQPVFWKQALDAQQQHATYLSSLIANDQVVSLVARDGDELVGFVFGTLVPPPPVYAPGGPSGLIDDFAVTDPDTWSTVGAALLTAAAHRLAELGAVQMVVVCGHHDKPKMEALLALGLDRASEWLVSPLKGAKGLNA